MKLSEVVGVPVDPDPDISGLTADSREARPGCLFAALPGVAADGARFIDAALAKGAVAILAGSATVDARPDLRERGVAMVGVADARRSLALAAARFHVGQPEKTVAVTGTNGKTSTAWFAAGVWRRLGRSAGVVGTLGAIGDGFQRSLAHTTPDPVMLHRTLAAMASAGIERLAIEASSHGLAQSRVDGVRLAAAGFTNITQDHLDYHPDFDAYFAAKRRLFETCVEPGGAGVFCMDGAGAEGMRAAGEAAGLRIIETGRLARDVRLVDVTPAVDGLRARVSVSGREVAFAMPCIGSFQVDNGLVAAALASACEDGASLAEAVAALDGLDGPPGRMQRAGTARGAAVYVDYAHTPDALRVVLAAARRHASGRLLVVLGAGGDRDRGKRPLMGRAAAELADFAIVTDDNPRSEDPAAIRREVMAGAPSAAEVGDRAEAIMNAVSRLEAGDVLIVAGKGHEQGQIIGDRVTPFDDVRAVAAAIEAQGGVAAGEARSKA